MITQELPFKDMNLIQALNAIAILNQVPEFTQDISDQLYDFLTHCF